MAYHHERSDKSEVGVGVDGHGDGSLLQLRVLLAHLRSRRKQRAGFLGPEDEIAEDIGDGEVFTLHSGSLLGEDELQWIWSTVLRAYNGQRRTCRSYIHYLINDCSEKDKHPNPIVITKIEITKGARKKENSLGDARFSEKKIKKTIKKDSKRYKMHIQIRSAQSHSYLDLMLSYSCPTRTTSSPLYSLLSNTLAR
ncbi:hypothetical protein ACMD2_22966 [Ananas comosus]|uniref:Uncharacterized protein n=1 Tax=Ananas comosus TaxID=4615 RepID=A0A199V1P1_ANACO|nr:hypothetical protein ACMD2_22966 [Ananas comosus]